MYIPDFFTFSTTTYTLHNYNNMQNGDDKNWPAFTETRLQWLYQVSVIS